MDDIAVRKIIQFRNGNASEKDDTIVQEVTVQLSIQCQHEAVFTCSPSDIEFLAEGYLVSSGIVTPENKIIHIDYIPEKQSIDVTLKDNSAFKSQSATRISPTGCGGGIQLMTIPQKKRKSELTSFSIEAPVISKLMKEFSKASPLFQLTGGVHSAAIADRNFIRVFMEDIGRHNAVDKVIGAWHHQKGTFQDTILLTTGRISSEIVFKAAHAGLPVILSRSAPTFAAIELADQFDITLIGFARANNFNIYSHSERVKF